MSASSTPPSSGDNQLPQATDPLAWRRHLPALATAAAGINEACDAWDAVSDSLCDADGWPLDDKVYGDGKVKRDAEAWKHAEVFLDHGPEVLAGVRAAATGPDYVEGPISDDLRRIRGIDTILFRAEELRHEWAAVMGLWTVRSRACSTSTRSVPRSTATPKAGTTHTNSAPRDRRWCASVNI
ncbi:hypothetical protein [Streptomyces sp. NPDC051640]|uniref:hypothetical protein n=1 Tax=Streptomyces sp. NPDC051640 TaxID=3365664 RepID=UPI0037A6A37D